MCLGFLARADPLLQVRPVFKYEALSVGELSGDRASDSVFYSSGPGTEPNYVLRCVMALCFADYKIGGRMVVPYTWRV